MNKIKLTKLISYLTGPEVWFSILLITIIFKSGLTSNQIYILLPLLLIFQILIPLGTFHYFIKTKRVSGWHLDFKEDRLKLAPVGIFAIIAGLIITFFFGNVIIFDLAIISYIVVLVIGYINKYWKISIHATISTLSTLLINYLFNWKLPELFLLIPIVFWARYTLKKHDLPQLLGGFIITGIIVLVGLYLFGLLITI